MKLYIKNMVCPRCISAVDKIVRDLDIIPLQVELGEVLLQNPISIDKTSILSDKLKDQGFELLDDTRKQQIEKIKNVIIDHIHHKDDAKFNFPELISNVLHKEYSSLSKLFSSTEGITIEQFIILQKIEKVKEYLIYDQLNLSEIANNMGYSSVAHLSAQFKKTIGLTPSQFKLQGKDGRKALDKL